MNVHFFHCHYHHHHHHYYPSLLLGLGEVSNLPNQPRIGLWMCLRFNRERGERRNRNGLSISCLPLPPTYLLHLISSTPPIYSETEVAQMCHHFTSWSQHKLFPLPGSPLTSLFCLPKTYTSGVMNLPLAGSFGWPLCELYRTVLFTYFSSWLLCHSLKGLLLHS